MRTRNAGNPKSPPPQKKTPPARKSATKTSKPTPDPAESTPSTDAKLESGVEAENASGEGTEVSPANKDVPAAPAARKVTKRVVKKKVSRPKTPTSAKVESVPMGEVGEANEEKGEDSPKVEQPTDVKDADCPEKEEAAAAKESGAREESVAQNVEDVEDKGKTKMEVEEQPIVDTEMTEAPIVKEVAKPVEEDPNVVKEDEKQEQMESVEVEDSSVVKEGEKEERMKERVEEEEASIVKEGEKQEQMEEKVEEDLGVVKEEEKQEDMEEKEGDGERRDQLKEEVEDHAAKVESEMELQGKQDKPDNMDEDQNEKVEREVDQSKEDKDHEPAEMVECGEEVGFVEPGEEDLQEDEEPQTGEGRKQSEEENPEFTAAAKERKMKKELEVFIGGLDRDVVEDDLKKAFEKVGEVVEVRLLKDPSTNKNRGFAFVRFANKEQAKRAVSEMKNPVINGKRCGVAPNEENDTLFLGNICNTWTKEAIKQKLKDYGVEGVEHITLVQDARHEGLSRGFCFIQFSCHADAMSAYKRLQKPDAIFGHTERTAKVAFAEPVQEPDPEVMAKVKSVFVDGIPPYWDEDRVRKHFNCYGEIERITLARNMSTAKRRDFGFVDFTTHEAALACIEDVNSKDLVEGNSKVKVRVRLSNPLPKTQVVKGGMCGGFLIGRAGGRVSGRGGPTFSRPNFQYGRNAGPSGRRVPFRAAHYAPAGSAPVRPNLVGPRRGVIDRQVGRPVPPRREPFPPMEGGYQTPFMGRNYDDPYLYDDGVNGLKRPFHMTDQDPSYMEPSPLRPRFDYSDSARGTRFRDTFGAGSSSYSSGYYGPDYGGGSYGGGSYSSFHGRGRSYGGGYYY